jgi:predicted nucleic acid-binding protein
MHAEYFLDTNILLYAASSAKSEQGKRIKARELLMADGAGLSVQVLAEFYVNATNKFKLPHDKVARMIEALDSYPVLAVSETVFWAALQIKERYKLSYRVFGRSEPWTDVCRCACDQSFCRLMRIPHPLECRVIRRESTRHHDKVWRYSQPSHAPSACVRLPFDGFSHRWHTD